MERSGRGPSAESQKEVRVCQQAPEGDSVGNNFMEESGV